VTFGPFMNKTGCDNITQIAVRPKDGTPDLVDSQGNFVAVYGTGNHSWGESQGTRLISAPNGTTVDITDKEFCTTASFQSQCQSNMCSGGTLYSGICGIPPTTATTSTLSTTALSSTSSATTTLPSTTDSSTTSDVEPSPSSPSSPPPHPVVTPGLVALIATLALVVMIVAAGIIYWRTRKAIDDYQVFKG